ncbi:SDR family NAD(P)-dependent oxidoreductase [Gordonia sp. NPDC003376]
MGTRAFRAARCGRPQRRLRAVRRRRKELSENEIRDQLVTNHCGVWWVTQAALPMMRAQQRRRIVQVSTIGGLVTFVNPGGCHTSKCAVEGLTDSVGQEVAAEASRPVRRGVPPCSPRPPALFAEASASTVPGSPAAVGGALPEIVDAENPSLRVFCASGLLRLGSSAPRVFCASGLLRLRPAVDRPGLCTPTGSTPGSSGRGLGRSAGLTRRTNERRGAVIGSR